MKRAADPRVLARALARRRRARRSGFLGPARRSASSSEPAVMGPSVDALPARGPADTRRARPGDRHGSPAQPAHRRATRARVVRMAELERALVRAAGLLDAAGHCRTKRSPQASRRRRASAARSSPACSSLRYNHPAAADGLELRPNDQATRAEAAYSFAKLLHLDDWRPRTPSRGPRTSTCPSSRLAAAHPRARRLLRRLPVRLGRHVGASADALRRHLARRLRLLRLRVARLQGSRATPARRSSKNTIREPHGLGDGRRDPEDRARQAPRAPAGRRHLLRRAAAPGPGRAR